MAQGDARRTGRFGGGRRPAAHRLARCRTDSYDRRHRRRHAAGEDRRRLGRPRAVFKRPGHAVSQGVAGARAGEGRHRQGDRAAHQDRRRGRVWRHLAPRRRSPRPAAVPLLQPAAHHPRAGLPAVHAKGTNPQAGGGTARTLHAGRDPALPADASGRGGRTHPAQAPAIHGGQHPLRRTGRRGAGRRPASRLQDRPAGGGARARLLPRRALGRGRAQGTARHGDRHGAHEHPAHRDGVQAPKPLDRLLRPPPGGLDDQPRGPRQRGLAWTDAPAHRRLPPADRAARRRGGDARLDQSEARALHAHPRAAGDPRLVGLLAARLPAALPALGRLQQTDGRALRHALGHSRREGLRAGAAGERTLQGRQRPPRQLAALGGADEFDLRRHDAARLRARRADRLVCGRPRRDRRRDDARPADRVSRLPGDVLRAAGRPLQLHDLADELSLRQPAGARTARHADHDRRDGNTRRLERRGRRDPLRQRHLRLRPQPAGAAGCVV